MENRHGLIATAIATTADGHAERDAALLMLEQKQMDRSQRITVGADKAYDTEDFVRTARELNVTVHVQKNEKGPWPKWTGSSSSVAPRTTCCVCHGCSQNNSSKTPTHSAPESG